MKRIQPAVVAARAYPYRTTFADGTPWECWVFHPIFGEGESWHMGLPQVCTHERIAWADDFYASEDHGQCSDCGLRVWREARNLERDGEPHWITHGFPRYGR